MEDKDLTLKEAVKIINSCFPDDDPIFIVESGQFKGATSDWRERLKLKDAQKSINWTIFIQLIRRHLRYDCDYKN